MATVRWGTAPAPVGPGEASQGHCPHAQQSTSLPWEPPQPPLPGPLSQNPQGIFGRGCLGSLGMTALAPPHPLLQTRTQAHKVEGMRPRSSGKLLPELTQTRCLPHPGLRAPHCLCQLRGAQVLRHPPACPRFQPGTCC